MKDKDFEKVFEDLNFDIQEPSAGHRERFFEKLEKQAPPKKTSYTRVRNLWGPLLGIAAGFALAVLLTGIYLKPQSNYGELASVSPEMKETQLFYTSLIERELKNIEEEKSPETQAIVTDAMVQMEKLETRYEQLKKDLVSSGNDNRVIYAMINNFQQRIDLLTQVLEQIEEIKTLKNQNHETNII